MPINPDALKFFITNCKTSMPVLKQLDDVVLNPFREIIRDVPENWGSKIVQQIRHIRAHRNELDPRIIQALKDYLPMIMDVLSMKVEDGSIPKSVIFGIQEIQEKVPYENCEDVKYNQISINLLPKYVPEISIVEDGEITWINDVYNGIEVKIPLAKGIIHKGGAPRYILKRVFKSSLIDPEVPFTDWDIAVTDLEAGKKFMMFVGEKDFSGIEKANSYNHLINSRDVTCNKCLLSKKRGLVYTDDAKEAIVSGCIFPYGGDHGIYGNDVFQIQGHKLYKPRVFDRLVKFVVDGKAKSFGIKEENLQLFMGIVGIMVIYRAIKKANPYERLTSAYFLLDKMGQLEKYEYVFKHKFGAPCGNIFEFLEGLHTMYPFTLLEARGGDAGIARWLMFKILNYSRRRFKQEYNVHDTDFSWFEIDPKEKIVIFSLDDFRTDAKTISKLEKWFPGYLERCHLRNVKEGYAN